MTLPDEVLRDLYRWWPVARLATLTATGRPHIVPIVFCAHEDALYSPIDGKRKRSAPLKRLHNIEANPDAALLFDAYAHDWSALWWVRMEVDADLFHPSHQLAEHIAAQLLEKYPQYRDTALSFDLEQYVRLRPTKIRWWAQSGSAEQINVSVRQARSDA